MIQNMATVTLLRCSMGYGMLHRDSPHPHTYKHRHTTVFTAAKGVREIYNRDRTEYRKGVSRSGLKDTEGL